MANPTLEILEERVAELETQMEQLKQRQELDKSDNAIPWWEKIRGQFKDDPAYDEAMRLGREWRESQRPPDYEEI